MAEVMAQLTARPPFTNQLDHQVRQAAAEQRVADLRRRAMTPEALGEAARIYDVALARRPDDWYLHDRLAHLAKMRGRPDAAADHWRTVLQEFPRLNDRRRNWGKLCSAREDSRKRPPSTRRSCSWDPQDAEAHNGLGMALIQQGDFESAAGQFRQALELRPNYFDAQINMGMALSQQEKFDEAVACFLKAQELDPARAESHINLANVLYRQGQIPAAVMHWRDGSPAAAGQRRVAQSAGAGPGNLPGRIGSPGE